MKRYAGIIFDLDGTLVDSFPGIHHSLSHAMREVGLAPWDLEQTRQNVGRGVDHLLETAVGPERKRRALARFQADYADSCREKTSLLPGVREGLAALGAAGILLAVATNKPLVFTRTILDTLEIRACFASVMAPDLVGPPKPHPAMLDAIRHDLGLAAADCLYVGDMPLDAETASRARVDCLLVSTGSTGYESLRQAVAVPVVRGFSEILPWVEAARSGGVPSLPPATG